MSQFTYTPINLSRPAFRLVSLAKGTGITTIHCSLIVAFFDQPSEIIPYEALSYHWGSSGLTDKIFIDGHELGVTANLYLALQYLRSEDEDRILWIDGICIDQGNDQEKGHQVNQMDNIYRRAERVVIWLGPATYETNVLMDSMSLLGERSAMYSRSQLMSSPKLWRKVWSEIQPELRKIHSRLDIRQREGLENILKQRWFRRVWILQEVANARTALILCGRKSVSTKVFALIPSLVGVTPDAHCQAVLDIMPGYSRETSWWSQSRDLATLIMRFARCEATDPRDKFYALLSMSSDASGHDSLQADYSKPLHVVLKDVASFIFRQFEWQQANSNFESWTIPDMVKAEAFLNDAGLLWSGTEGLPPELRLLLALIRQDVNLNFEGTSNDSPLWLAARTNQKLIVELFLTRKDIDINAKSLDGNTVLGLAAGGGHEEMVRRFLAVKGADVNAEGGDGNTVLAHAVKTNRLKIAQLLLAVDGINVNARMRSGNSVLGYAVDKVDEESSLPFVKLLLATDGIDVNAKAMDGIGRSVLGLAVEKGHSKIVRLLLAVDGIDVNTTFNDGNTALGIAAERSYNRGRYNQGGVMEQLLAVDGIGINLYSLDGLELTTSPSNDRAIYGLENLLTQHKNINILNIKSLLLKAAQSRNTDLVEFLLARNSVGVDAMDLGGHVKLTRAVYGGYREITRLLLTQKHVDVNAKNWEQGGDSIKDCTPLLRAVSHGNTDIVRLLLAREDVDVNAKDRHGLTSLIKTVSQGHADIVRLLLTREDVDVNAKDPQGLTSLVKAVSQGHAVIIRLLLERKDLDVNAKDATGLTPLMTAVSQGHTETLGLLFGREDLDLKAKDPQGRTALRTAIICERRDIVKLLLGYRFKKMFT